MKPTRYFYEADRAGNIQVLARIRWDETGIIGEYLDDRAWIEDRDISNFLIDPSYGTEISFEEAVQLAELFGGLPPSEK